MTPQTKSLLLFIAVNACRALLAATFIFSGFVKANDPLGVVYKIEDYLSAIASIALPDTFLLGCAALLALFEFTLGVYILFGMKRRLVSSITVMFMTAMTLLTVYIAIADPVDDCGCFGDVLVLSNRATLAKNIVLLVAAMLCCRYYRLQKDFLSSGAKWFIALVSLCGIVIYTIYCTVNLPLIDFRPYKIGTDLREVVVHPSQQERFDVKIIYKKEGQILELTAEDPDPDSTWIYVETRRTPIKGTAAADFCVTDNNGEDITHTMLLADGYTFLLVIPDLTNADEGCVDRINEVYNYAQDKGLAFYCLTASDSKEAQDYWSDHTGAEYDYHLADDRMLKTVVRGQPGLVLLHDGIVLAKWSNWNMPDEETLAEMNLEEGA